MKTKPITKEAVRSQVEFFKRAAVKPAPEKKAKPKQTRGKSDDQSL